MEILNGRVKKIMGRGTKQAVDMGRNSSHYNNRWLLRGLIISCLLSTMGCSTLKSSLMTAGATATTVGVVSALTPSVIAPAVAGGSVAAVASALTAEPSVKAANITADKVVNKAPDNFWTLLGKLISMGGWALILIVVVPMLFSWLMPGPIQFKGKKKNGS
jgi:hypothetical protein